MKFSYSRVFYVGIPPRQRHPSRTSIKHVPNMMRKEGRVLIEFVYFTLAFIFIQTAEWYFNVCRHFNNTIKNILE